MRQATIVRNAAIVEAHKSGAIVCELADKFDLKRVTIQKILCNEGFSCKDNGGLTDDQQRLLVFKYTSGGTIPALSREYGKTARNISKILHAWGIKTSLTSRNQRRTEKKTDYIIETYKKTHSVYVTASTTKTGMVVVTKVLRANGFVIEKGNKKHFEAVRAEQAKVILPLWHDGLSAYMITRKTKISFGTVKKILIENDLWNKS